MSLVKLFGWSVATGVLGYMSFMASAFAGAGAVPPPTRAAAWNAVISLFAPIYVFILPGAIVLAQIFHFTALAAYAHWVLISAALVSVAYPFVLMRMVSS